MGMAEKRDPMFKNATHKGEPLFAPEKTEIQDDVNDSETVSICSDGGFIQLYLAITCVGLASFLVLFIFLYCSERSMNKSLTKACSFKDPESDDDQSLNSAELT
jgi:hypothetical protein